ncbi:uncharacterized protein LOC124891567 [Capsicum annuum]|uniref:uncharacterized protein LOC124891567 n=1 Tax=Capsicum annuum TaxID=4072 RepID=UPI001FB05E67|nr:uncharacterized protein LOC124891567 [Capsicum annuum]
MAVNQDKIEKHDMVLEGILPLAIEVGNMMEAINNNKEDMDVEDLVDNIDNVEDEGNLGDFDVIRNEEEKLGGLLVTVDEMEEFNPCINICNLEEIAFKRSKYTWWNSKIDEHYIFKRLDKSKQTFGNIFQEIATLEEVIKVRQKQFEEEPSGVNRANLFRALAELDMQLKREEDFWRKKAGFEWFKDGERNTRFFHTIVKRRRSRLKIRRIQNDEGSWLDNQDKISEAATMFYQKQFEKQEDAEDLSMLEVLPKIIIET